MQRLQSLESAFANLKSCAFLDLFYNHEKLVVRINRYANVDLEINHNIIYVYIYIYIYMYVCMYVYMYKTLLTKNEKVQTFIWPYTRT